MALDVQAVNDWQYPEDERGLDRHDGAAPSRYISEWSRKSRSRMVKRLAQLDYGPMFEGGRVPAMVTVTLPGDWYAVAPSAAVVAGYLRELRRRYRRSWGEPLVGTWKREFQERGAPHYHLFMVPPAGRCHGQSFREWLSVTWANIVDADRCDGLAGPCEGGCCEYHRHVAAGTGVDFAEGARATDPRRLAVYFSKHGGYSAKEYQNHAPREWLHAPGCDGSGCAGCAETGVGRFWGYWGLRPVLASADVDSVLALEASRVLRRHHHANSYSQAVTVWRKVYRHSIDPTTGEMLETWRWVKRASHVRSKRMRSTLGYSIVNDGPMFAAQLAEYLATVPEDRDNSSTFEGGRWRAGPWLRRGFLP